MYRNMLIAGLAVIAIPTLASTAYAQDAAQPTIDTAATPAAIVTLTPTLTFSDYDALSDTDLGELRGGDAIVVGTQTLTATTTGNVINGNFAAGNIAITGNALSNFNGLGNLVINTGAQNSLQSATNVTINIAP